MGAFKNPNTQLYPSPIKSESLGMAPGPARFLKLPTEFHMQSKQSVSFSEGLMVFVSQRLLTQSLINGIFTCKYEIILVLVKINLLVTVCFGEELNLKRERRRLLVWKPDVR